LGNLSSVKNKKKKEGEGKERVRRHDLRNRHRRKKRNQVNPERVSAIAESSPKRSTEGGWKMSWEKVLNRSKVKSHSQEPPNFKDSPAKSGSSATK